MTSELALFGQSGTWGEGGEGKPAWSSFPAISWFHFHVKPASASVLWVS